MEKLYLLFLLITLLLISCERDDICAEATPTTPRLLIEFYDATNIDDLKNVARLTVYGEGLITNPTESSDTTIVYNANTNAIELPLRIGAEGSNTVTRYILEKNTDLRLDDNASTTSNIDIIEINYTNEFVYVSRACGYKNIFNNLDIDVDVNDDDTWISSIGIDEITVENENTVHARILH